MPQNYCHHINSAGIFCRGIPVNKRDYCYWHLHENGRRMKAARSRARCERVIINFPILDDLPAIQVALMQVGGAILHGEIDHRTGRLLLAVLRQAASNLKVSAIWEQQAGVQDAELDGYAEQDDEFEERYHLPQDFDLSVDPEVAFPPPQETPVPTQIPAAGVRGDDADLRAKLGQMLRDATTPIPGVDLLATPEDVELWEVYERHGEAAGLQRAYELDRDRKRRERRLERKRYEELARNRNIQTAAQKLFWDREREAAAAASKAQAVPADNPPAAGQAEAELNRKPPQPQGAASQAVASGDGGV